MKNYLETLRNKPDENKKSIAKISAITVTVLIVIIWLILTSLNPQAATTTTQEDTSFFKGFNTLINNGLKSFATVSDKLDENPIDPIIEAMETMEDSEAVIEIDKEKETENYGTE